MSFLDARNGIPVGLGSVAGIFAGRWTPSYLFGAGEQGVWYDPSDFSTLFQDSAGTTPVTAVEQPVGLMLDKSKGLVLGPELIASSSPSGSGWAGTYTTASGNTVTFSAQFGNRRYSLNTSGDKWYRFSFTARRISGNTALHIFHENSANGDYTAFTATGTATAYQVTVRGRTGGGAINFGVQDRNTSGFGDLEVYNISVRELPGNHAYQTTSASRPVLSARYNLLTKTEQFDDAGWTKFNVTSTASKITPNTSNAFHITNQTVSYAASGFISVIEAKADGYQYLQVFLSSGANFMEGVFNLSGAGSVENTSRNSTWTGTRSITLLPDGYYRCVVTIDAATATAGLVQIGVSNTSNTAVTFAGDGTSGILVRKADLRVANDGVGIPAYQRVDTATSYDTVGFPTYLKFDGVDDGMVTNSIDFTATNKMTVWTGVRKLSDGAYPIIAELSSAWQENLGTISLGGNTSNGYVFTSRGTNNAAIIQTGYLAPITNVLSAAASLSGDSAILRVNGTQAASSTDDQGTGNYGNYPLYIGRRGGTTLPFNGRISSLIIRGAQSTDAQIASTENYVNQKTKAY